MKLKDSFITHMSNGEQILVDVSGEFSGLIRNNESAARIVDCLKTETSIIEIVEQLSLEYEASNEELESAVKTVIDKLRSVGAIDE
ncbi:PqqD family protein [Holdemanella biformis]|uniref:PqqD family protein n=1 Tax=Holdemanella biformis TaxID=1735 RepID=UPI0026DC9BED|nr:PqqD family protein [Holdemanella biformis]